jgi:hypothetical protein
MQKRLALLPAIALTAAACSTDPATSPRTPSAPRFATSFTSASAPSGAHYRNGFSEPECGPDGAGGFSCTGTAIAGVGNTDATVLLSVSYSATVQCRNRGGKIVDVKTQTTTDVSSDELTELRNGTLFVSAVSAAAPSAESLLAAASCPNGNWTKILVGGSASVTSYSYSLIFDGFSQPAISISG